MNLRKLLFLMVTTFAVVFAFPNKILADTDLFTGDNLTISRELNDVTEFNDNGLPIINIDRAYEVGLSPEAIEIAHYLNDIVLDIETNGESSAIAKMEKALFPIGSYGNYCGKGNNGWTTPPIDDLDTACRHHDICFKGFSQDNRECNIRFLAELAPIIQKNSILTAKGAYPFAAAKLFTNFI